MSGHCCGPEVDFDGMDAGYKRRLWAVIALNAAMFAVELVSGQLARSQALHADALDFFGDSVTYAVSLLVIGKPIAIRARVALIKGISLLAMGAWVLGSTIYRIYVVGVPEATVMGAVGFLALLANLGSVLLLANYREGDANVRSVWLCSRNDAIGNLAVMCAALGVWGSASGWPDLLVAAVMAGLFISSATKIIGQARRELEGMEKVSSSL